MTLKQTNNITVSVKTNAKASKAKAYRTPNRKASYK
jgi:hypothetical protein